ncbi:MAG: amidohydrolase family protein, partial [Bacteroidota bacterium]
MKNYYAAILVIFLLCFSCQPAEELFEGAIIIEHVNTIDPTDGLKTDQSIVIREGKIIKIAPSSQLKLSPENKIINGTGKYLIPGLWDAHVHFAFIEELAPRMFELFLAYGITSVRDTGGKIDFVSKWKKKAQENPQNAPRVKIAGPLLDGMPNVYDGSTPMRPELSVGNATVEELEAQIRGLHEQGVDLLKAYEMLTPEQFKTVTKLGKELGLPVTGHVPLSMDVITASNAGLNSMEHMRNLELSAASNAAELWEERKQMLEDGKNDAGGDLRSRIHSTQRPKAVEHYDEAVADEVLAVLAKNETWQVPTLALSTGMVEQPFSRPDFQEGFQYLPDYLEFEWKNGAERVSKTKLS